MWASQIPNSLAGNSSVEPRADTPMDGLIKFRWIWVAVLVVIAAILSAGLPTAMETDNALTVWFLDTDPRLQTYEEFQEQFGNDEAIALHLQREDGIFSAPVLQQIQEVSRRLEEVDYVAQVQSLLTLRAAVDTEEGLDFLTLFDGPIPEDEAALNAARDRAVNNALYRDRLVSGDATQAILWVELEGMGDYDAHRDRVVGEVRQVADDLLGPGDYNMGGLGVVYSAMNVLTEKDAELFVTIVYLLMILLIWWIFRSWRILLGALGVITIATLASLGIYGLMGNKTNMVTVVIPVLVAVLGIADAVHLPTTFNDLRKKMPDADHRELVAKALRHVMMPCLLTTLTTVGCFLALVSSPMLVIRQLGIYSAIGIGAALVATYIMMTAALCALPEDYRPPKHTTLNRFLDSVRFLVIRRTTAVVMVMLLVVGASLWGASKVEVDTYTIGYLPDSHRVVEEHKALEEHWGPYSLVEYVLRPHEGLQVQDPEVMAAVEEFAAQATQHEQVQQAMSLVDIYRQMVHAFVGDELTDEELAAPLTQEQVEQVSLLISMLRLQWDRDHPDYDENFLTRLINEERDLARISLTTEMMSAKQMEALFDALEQAGQELSEGVGVIEPAGYPALYVEIIDYVMVSMVRGFLIALALIFFLLLIGLRSFRLALIGVPANVFPVLVMLGVMGFLGVDLDVGTAMVGAIVIGIAIDDSVHFLHHWKSAEAQGLDWESCVAYAFRHAGKAALVTTTILVGGFPVLMLSGMQSVFYMGLLTTIAAAAALLADLFFLPILLRYFGSSKESSKADGGEGDL